MNIKHLLSIALLPLATLLHTHESLASSEAATTASTLVSRAQALPALPNGTKGELKIEFRWKARHVGKLEFKDLTVLDRSTSIVCPLVASDEQTTSVIVGATADQVAANKQLGEAAKATIDSIPSDTIDQMTALDKQMKACRKAGGSEQSCGMQIMMEMQKNPNSLMQLGQRNADAQVKAEAAVKAAESRIQPWFNEGCTGQMIVNDSRKLDDPTIPGEEPTIHTSGTQKIDTKDTLITVETDLATGTTRYMFVSPEASGFLQEAYYGEVPKTVNASAMPKSVEIVGPIAGPIQNGSHSYKAADGEVTIVWTFRKLD